MRIIVAGLFLTLTLSGQQVVSLQTAGDFAVLTIRVKPTNFVTISGAPYSGKRVTTGVQTRPDGNRVDENRTVLFYRDSAGRNRTERPVSIPGSPVVMTIMDPTVGCEYVLDPGNKTAHKLLGIEVRTRPASGVEAMEQTGEQLSSGAGNPAGATTARTQTENLGTQTMQGMLVRGSRTTTTWPVGTLDKNDHEVTTTEESWWAPALAGVVISSKTSRPQLTEDYSVSDVKLGDPDASLFSPPAGYRVVEEGSDFQIRIPQTSTPAVTKLSSHGQAPAAISGAPFSGVRTNIVVQLLPDGTREQHPERTVFLSWRDSQGRVRTEWPGQGTMAEAVEIQDPIAGFTYSLDYVAKVARRTAFAPAQAASPAALPANSQSLGSRTISNVPANGVKTTTVSPAGTAPATNKPFTASTEIWTASKEGVTLLEKTSTSAGNEATIELKHFSTLEPDPSLFRIPATYRIVDENGSELAAATAHPPSVSADGTAAAGTQAVRPNPGESVFTFRSPPGMNMPAMTRAPYSVQTISQTVRTQPGGALATQQPAAATTANYRDSMGRTRVERAQGGSSTPQQPIVLPDINDPVAGYRYILDPVHQVAHRMVIATRRINPAQVTPVSLPAMPPTSQTMANGMTLTMESLGTKMIDGILAMGTRNTTTMPARSPQDQPTTNVSETWSSVQYNTVLRSTSTGLNNQTTTTAKELSETEPDAALFQVPRDYKIVDEEGPFSITIPHPVP